MSDDDSQKTEEPTQKKLDESRKKGQVALSREVNNWIMLLAGTIMVAIFGPGVMSRIANVLKSYFEHAHAFPELPGGLSVVMGQSFMEILGILLFPTLFLICAAVVGPFIQVGPLFAPEAIQPKFSKISPIQGAKRLFSKRALVEFGKGMVKIMAIGVVGFILLSPFYAAIEHTIGLPIAMVLLEIKALFIRLMLGVLMVLVVIMMADLVFTRVEHHEKMKMSKQEVKDEYKQTEGDPHVKAKLRQLRAEKSRQRMMAAVPEADVVITNPTHFSVALKYDPEAMDAPVCVAKGVDTTALRIREIAKEHDIVLFENPPLARVLHDTVDIDDIIPPEHYKAVAEVISYVFKLKGKMS